MKPVRNRVTMVLAAMAVLLLVGLVQAAKISDVRATKHNLSAATDGTATPSGTVPVRTIKSSTETQVCVFCHTPHAAENIPSVGNTPGAPLWNRTLSTATYTGKTYTSTSIEATASELSSGPGGSSKLCLSCHDGTMGIDKVNVLNGLATNIAMKINGVDAASPVKMPAASGATTGFTRNLGSQLSNDHPISFSYNDALVSADGELRTPSAENTVGGVVMNRAIGKAKPVLPLENNQVQCATCHDPHLNDTTDSTAKFLRVSRLQGGVSSPANNVTFSQSNDIICLACHEKAGWANSAHANSSVSTQAYTTAAAAARNFPSGTKVWQAACLNCHDTHTAEGAKRLLREGTDSIASPKTGGNPALEETCYQCHTTSGESAVTYIANTATAVPDIKTDFTGSNKRMPIATTTEVHDIGGSFNDSAVGGPNCQNTPTPSGNCGKDLLESRAKLANRHVECSDCHNPHRVIKNREFTGLGDAGAGTHPHTDTAMNHTNIASGVLRGSWGVEVATYTNTTYPGGLSTASFHAMPATFSLKKGEPTTSATTVGSAWVTREYQICLKCHSNYGYADNNLPQTDGGAANYSGVGNRPTLGGVGTFSGTNGVTMYTNQGKEFQAPSGHVGPATNVCLNAGTAAGAAAAYNNCNHRSWHPVIEATGRTLTTRGGISSANNPWLAPWSNQVGANTMYCSDCHGSKVTTSLTTVIPENGDNGSPWGPHGSANDFLLKGEWTDTDGGNNNLLCFKCHVKAAYSGTTTSGTRNTGFFDDAAGPTKRGNLHRYHANKLGKELRCTWCHVAVPHGWKNKALLVNLNDLGPEVGKAPGTAAPGGTYTNGPYYYKSVLRITSFAKSGAWNRNDCGGGNTDSAATAYMKNTMCNSTP